LTDCKKSVNKLSSKLKPVNIRFNVLMLGIGLVFGLVLTAVVSNFGSGESKANVYLETV